MLTPDTIPLSIRGKVDTSLQLYMEASTPAMKAAVLESVPWYAKTITGDLVDHHASYYQSLLLDHMGVSREASPVRETEKKGVTFCYIIRITALWFVFITRFIPAISVHVIAGLFELLVADKCDHFQMAKLAANIKISLNLGAGWVALVLYYFYGALGGDFKQQTLLNKIEVLFSFLQ